MCPFQKQEDNKVRLCYQVATPDVAIAPSVTAFQGELEQSFAALKKIGYDGVEFMTLDPKRLDWPRIKKLAADYGLKVVLVCTGEVFGQLQLSFMNPEARVRQEARQRVKEIIDFAGFLGAKVNIGRVRGQYREGEPREKSYGWAVEAFQDISDYAAPQGVAIALETVTLMQTNFINTLQEAVQAIKDTNRDNFRLMMDVFHLNLEEKNLLEAIKTYQPYNIHVHLADNNRRYPGQCGLDFRRIIRTFHDTGYDDAFCTEIFQLPDQETAAKGAYQCLAPLFEEIYGRQAGKI
jgi:sugar phosphate isomerase/epimerase